MFVVQASRLPPELINGTTAAETAAPQVRVRKERFASGKRKVVVQASRLPMF